MVSDAETEAKKTKKVRQSRIKQEPQPIQPRERSTRIRRPNSLLKGYAETNEQGEITKELGGAIIGGKMYYLQENRKE